MDRLVDSKCAIPRKGSFFKTTKLEFLSQILALSLAYQWQDQFVNQPRQPVFAAKPAPNFRGFEIGDILA